ncbi:MAG TPA: hypothetical protein VKZ53_22405 [Candidatus Angelobacter sp.]|nr:hypothetical protein [Candidatus Angelobacter sp.]
MSQNNILNPTSSSVFNPEYPLRIVDPSTVARAQARSGRVFAKRVVARGPVFSLQWNNRQFSTYNGLRQWFRQYSQDFFTLYDIDGGRYYSGQFQDEPQYEIIGNDKVNITATFVVIPGLPMFQYPSTWGIDSIMFDERDGFGADLVKLTGNWDHRTKNLLLFSQDMENTTPVNNTPGGWFFDGGSSVLADSAPDPNGGQLADVLTKGGGSFINFASIFQPVAYFPRPSQSFTVSCYLAVPPGAAALPGVTLNFSDTSIATNSIPLTLTTAPQRFSFTSSGFGANNRGLILAGLTIPGAAGTKVTAWGWQLESGTAPSVYTSTTNAVVELPAPNPNPAYFNGFAYWSPGTSPADAAEWIYLGYGFRLWSPRNTDMGIAQAFIDGVGVGNVDMFAPVLTASAPVLTVQNIQFGLHRVKISPTNTKNAGSSDFIIAADAVEAMQ